MTTLIIVLVYAAVLLLVVYPLMKAAGPQSEAEQLENDNEQLEYIRNRRSSSSKYWDEL